MTNASVIRRVWENQADFQTDVLAAVAAAGDSAGELGATVEALGTVLGALDVSSPDARLRSMSEVCRVAGLAAFRTLVESAQWSLWVGVWVLGATTPPSPDDRRIRDALVEGYLRGTDLWMGMHGAVLPLLGLRPRAPLTLRQFTVSTGALVEGCALRQVGAEDLDVIERPTGPGGSHAGVDPLRHRPRGAGHGVLRDRPGLGPARRLTRPPVPGPRQRTYAAPTGRAGPNDPVPDPRAAEEWPEDRRGGHVSRTTPAGERFDIVFVGDVAVDQYLTLRRRRRHHRGGP